MVASLLLLITIFVLFDVSPAMAKRKKVPAKKNYATQSDPTDKKAVIEFPTFHPSSALPNDPFAQCRHLSSETIYQATTKSGGAKSRYFNAFRAAAGANLTLSLLDRTGGEVKLQTPAKTFLFIGDSVVREITERFERVLGKPVTWIPTATEYFNEDFSTVTTPTGRSHQVVKNAAANIFHGDGNLHQYRDAILSKVKDLGGRVDAVFVGGLALHHLVRGSPCGEGIDPVEYHRRIIAAHFKQMHELSSLLGTPFVFVGSQTVDAKVLMMTPSKKDWSSFNDFSLAEVTSGSLPQRLLCPCHRVCLWSLHVPSRLRQQTPASTPASTTPASAPAAL